MQRRFVTLDVFTDERFAGNPLAVVLDAEGLDTPAMQSIAREFNLSETVFVRPPVDPAHRAALRIFTPARELPFAGHPTVGTAVLLGLRDGGQNERELVLEETVGEVACRVTPGRNGGWASFTLPKLPAEIGPAPSASVLAAALGLEAADIGFAPYEPACWSAGNPFTFVPLRDIAALARARPDAAQLGAEVGTGVFVFTRALGDPLRFRARMFAPHLGIVEDPATGSAVAAFAGVLMRFAGLGDGAHDVLIEQGVEMGRPSRIMLGMTAREGWLVSATVGGDAVIVSEGTIEA